MLWAMPDVESCASSTKTLWNLGIIILDKTLQFSYHEKNSPASKYWQRKKTLTGTPRKQHKLWKQRFLYAGKILSLVTTNQGVAGLIQRIFERKNGPKSPYSQDFFSIKITRFRQ